MATNFPTSLQDLDATRGTSGQPLSTPSHVVHHTTEDDTIEALQAKVGVDSSAVTSSHDYKLGEVTSTDRAVGKSATQTLTNKTIALGSNTVSGTTAQFNTALTDDNFATLTGSETLTNKTLTTPTIGSFTNATHTHQDAAGGGTLVATSVFGSGTVPTARLGSGSASSSTFLRGDQTWAAASITCSSGTTNRDLAAANSTQTIAHGLASTPKKVVIHGQITNTSVVSEAICTFTSAACYLFKYWDLGAGTGRNHGVSSFNIFSDGSNNNSGVVTIDSTNINIAWTKNGSPTGNVDIMWEAIL